MFADNLIIMLGQRYLLRLYLAPILSTYFFMLLRPVLLSRVAVGDTLRRSGAAGGWR